MFKADTVDYVSKSTEVNLRDIYIFFISEELICFCRIPAQFDIKIF